MIIVLLVFLPLTVKSVYVSFFYVLWIRGSKRGPNALLYLVEEVACNGFVSFKQFCKLCMCVNINNKVQ